MKPLLQVLDAFRRRLRTPKIQLYKILQSLKVGQPLICELLVRCGRRDKPRLFFSGRLGLYLYEANQK